MRRIVGVAVTLFLLLALATPAGAVVIRDDRLDSAYTGLGASYPAVGRMVGGGILCSGTLIDPNWVLTAAHCSAVNGGTFTLSSGASGTIDNFISHPLFAGVASGYDIALAHLASPITTVTSVSLYTSTNEVGQLGIWVGWGVTGTGLTGYGGSAGTKRAMQNMIDTTGAAFGISANVLMADFDNPSNVNDSLIGGFVPLNLEGNIAPGDSGGGLFIGSAIAAVHSFIASVDGVTDADYGDLSGSTRVSSHVAWILSVTAVPEPGTFLLVGMGLGALALAGRRARRRRA